MRRARERLRDGVQGHAAAVHGCGGQADTVDRQRVADRKGLRGLRRSDDEVDSAFAALGGHDAAELADDPGEHWRP